MQDEECGAESIPVSDAEVVGVSTGPELLPSTQPYCCTCGFANPCLGGANNDLSPPSCGSLFCEASSPLSGGPSHPSVSMPDVRLLPSCGGHGDGGLGTPMKGCSMMEFVLRYLSSVSIRTGQLG
jgi:hypothetical protein